MILAGASLSLEGRFALQGRQALRGLELWTTWINGAGGLAPAPGRALQPVCLRVYNDHSRVAEAQKNVHRLLVEDRADLLFGPYSSVLTLAVAPIAEDRGKLLWNHGGSSDAIYSRGWHTVVGGAAPASTYFAGLPSWLRKWEPEIDHITVLHADRGTFARQVALGVAEAAEREGFQKISLVPCDLATIDPTHILAGESGGTPQAIVLAGNYQAEAGVIRMRNAFPGSVRRIAAVAAGLTAFGEAMGTRSEGLLGPSQWEPGLGLTPEAGPGEDWILAEFRRAFGQDPEYPALQAFAMGVVAAECVRRAGSLHDDAVREAAARLDITTCFGRFRIQPETGRQIGHRPVLVKWQGGRKTIAWPREEP